MRIESKKTFALDWNKVDLIVIISTVLISLFFTLFIYLFPSNNDNAKVEVYYDNKVIYKTDLVPSKDDLDPRYIILFKEEISTKYDEIYPTTNERKFANNSLLLDDLVIEINNKKVSIVKETSPNHICSNQGTISNPNNPPLVCMPNYVRIKIVNSSTSPDDDIIV